jgi:hypothetical protein
MPVPGNSLLHKISPPGTPHTNDLQNDSPITPSPEKTVEISILKPLSLKATDLKYVNKIQYSPEIGPAMYAWFSEKEKFHKSYDTYTWKNGAVSEKERKVANPPPQFSEFARHIGVTAAQLKRWSKKYPEFAEYYEACNDIVQEFFVENGVTGEYAGQFGIFAAKNLTKMKDVQINKNENYNMKDVLDAIEKGTINGEQHDI